MHAPASDDVQVLPGLASMTHDFPAMFVTTSTAAPPRGVNAVATHWSHVAIVATMASERGYADCWNVGATDPGSRAATLHPSMHWFRGLGGCALRPYLPEPALGRRGPTARAPVEVGAHSEGARPGRRRASGPKVREERESRHRPWRRRAILASGTRDQGSGHGDMGPPARHRPLIPDLVRERTSPAVQAALKDLLEAPSAGGAGRKTKRGKRT